MRWGLAVSERFLAHVNRDVEDGACWLWQGDWNEKDQSGPSFRISKKPSVKMRVNRYAWELWQGPIPQKKIVAQTCKNKRCVNPAHLMLDSTENRKELNKRCHEKRRLAIKAFLREFKKNCLHCGFDNPVALQFHHRDRSTKKFEINRWKGRKEADVLAEIAKCDVLCANCHAIVEDELRRAA